MCKPEQMNYVKLKIASQKLVFLVDLFIAQFAFLLSCLLFFRLLSIREVPLLLLASAALVLFINTYIGWNVFRLPKRVIRFSNHLDYSRLFLAAGFAHAISLIVFVATGLIHRLPFELWVVTFLFNVTGVISFRLGIRFVIFLFQEFQRTSVQKRLVVFGAGDLGLSLKRALDLDIRHTYKLVAFLDDDRTKIGKYIDGVPVWPASEGLSDRIIANGISEVIIAANDLPPQRKASFLEDLMVFDLKIQQLPPLDRWYASSFSLDKLEAININDLLNRDPILLHNDEVKRFCREHTVLVTGAAGSIGSEIVRKLAENGASSIACVDSGETALHELKLELKANFPHANIRFFVADIRDAVRMECIFSEVRPGYVFHAAAYKHVPLMEENPREAITTNVEGTRVLADIAVKQGVLKFVMISSDKAVNPTNVMGATKRVAEAYVQALNAAQEGTRFITTRFGNVLGSNGSVIPLFKQQIAKGGPLTVTHPDMVRYFMTIPEACQLVLEAAAMGSGGEVFIFEMGKPVKIVDLARTMIRLAGLIPDKDIEIVFSGMRPGEKLYEELFADEDMLQETHHPKIMIGKVQQFAYDEINTSIDRLSQCKDAAPETVRSTIKSIIPEYVYKPDPERKLAALVTA